MDTDPPDNRGLAALMVASGTAGLVLLVTASGRRSLILAVVTLACFIVFVALLGLGSVLREHERWREWSERQRLSDETADEKTADR
ncbi:MAG: hypothetical protein WA890_01800 [Micromonospora sp.]